MLPGNVEIIDNDRRSDISKRRAKLPWRNFVCGIWQRAFEERVEDRLFDVLHAKSPSRYNSDSIAVALHGFVVGELCHNRCLAPAVLCNDLNGTHGDTVDDLCEYAGARDPALLVSRSDLYRSGQRANRLWHHDLVHYPTGRLGLVDELADGNLPRYVPVDVNLGSTVRDTASPRVSYNRTR